jgi:tRNA pseudouridine38-40 synthase
VEGDVRLRIDLAYDGTGFSGWAKQPELPSVQASLENALARAFRIPESDVRTVVAGRTDSGVHATGQVCHVDVADDLLDELLGQDFSSLATRRLRGALGKSSSIRVILVDVAPKGFDARFSPLRRRYEYRIADALSTKDPRLANHTLWIDDCLDVEAMNRLGQELTGLHDFASFCRQRDGATTIRTLEQYSWHRDAEGVLIGTVVADAFCHSMVRSLVGAAIVVGKAGATVEEIVRLRDRTERTSVWKTQAAHGLTLVEVEYPPAEELAARAEQTRGTRELPSD